MYLICRAEYMEIFTVFPENEMHTIVFDYDLKFNDNDQTI